MKNTFIISTFTSMIAMQAHASIIINEIDYDQPGADSAEFIELFNNGGGAVALDGYSLQLINGGDGSSYRTINLDGFNLGGGGYFVICDNTALVTNCNYDFSTTASWLQNGAPDAIALFNDNDIIDAISYEGILPPYTEGTVLVVADSNSLVLSLGRVPDGFDSNDNFADFQQTCITPGSANIAGSGDCSVSVSAVPLPATAWLFGCGLLGLVGIARKQRKA